METTCEELCFKELRPDTFSQQATLALVLQASLYVPCLMSALLQPVVPRTFVDTSVLYLRFRPPFLKNRRVTTKYLSV